MSVYSKFLELQSGSQRTVDLSTNTLSIQGLQINAATGGGALTQAAHSATTSYSIVWPAAQAASSGYVLSNDGAGNLSWVASASGSVVSISVNTSNGFAGTSSGGSTPSLTLSTTVTGILYGNGTSVAAATAGNFPTLNQSTTGTASNITGIAALINGGTGMAAASANAAYAALTPMTTAGDLVYEDATPVPARLPIGSTGNVLTVVAGLPAWAAPSTSGTVTSVALSDGSTSPIYTVSGSPVTSSGTLTLTLASQTANKAFLSPNGSSGQPGFRSIAVADLPSGIPYANLTLTGDIVNADISGSAAIVYSKLSLINSIVNSDISSSAAIAYSKLNLTNSIVNADISSSAAIAYSKLNLASSVQASDQNSGAATSTQPLFANGSGGTAYRSIASGDLPSLSSIYLALAGGTMSGNIAMGSNSITGMANPVNPQDAATKFYIDNVVANIQWKAPVQAASPGSNVSLSAPGSTLDGYTFSSGDRFLAKDQSTSSENGIYIWNGAASPATRSTDMNTWTEVVGATMLVINGTVNAGSKWVNTNTAGGTIGTTAITFVAFSIAGTVNGTGVSGQVAYWTGTSTLAGENQLNTSRGGLGVNASAFTGVLKFASGVASASAITNSDLSGSAAITNANLATMAANTLKGNNTGSPATPSDLTVSQVQTMLSIPTSSSPLPLNAGGTGTSAASANAAFAALSPMTTAGDLVYEDATPAPTRLPIGSTGNVLTVVAGLPAWVAPSTSGTVTSVALTVPSFLSVSGSPITSSGTLAVTLSGTALPVANGGTGLTSGTSGGIIGFTASGTLTSSSALTASQLIIGGGAGATPSTLAAGSQYQVLVMGASNPGYGQVNLAQSAAITGTLPIGNGGTNVASVTIAPTATAFAGWDANKNLSANNLIEAYTTTATAASTTTLTVGSTYQQYFTGSTTQTITLPVAATLVNGMSFEVVNLSTGVVTVQTSGANTIQAMTTNTSLIVTCVDTAGGTGTASWSWTYSPAQSGLLPIALGGTGQSTASAAFNALSPITSTGDLILGTGVNTASRLAIGSTNQVLTVSGGTATWADATGFSNPMTTLGDIIYENSTPAPTRLAGNTGTTKNFLTQTGNGTVSAAPVWGTISAADLPTITLTGNVTGAASGGSISTTIANNVVDQNMVTTGVFDQATITGGNGTSAAVANAPAMTRNLVAGQTFTANTSYAVRWGLTANGETAGRIYAADITTSSFDLYYVIGMASNGTTVNAGSTIKVTSLGSFTLSSSDTAFGASTDGAPVFLSSSGAFSITSPSTSGQAITRIGIVQVRSATNTSCIIDVSPAVVGVN